MRTQPADHRRRTVSSCFTSGRAKDPEPDVGIRGIFGLELVVGRASPSGVIFTSSRRLERPAAWWRPVAAQPG